MRHDARDIDGRDFGIEGGDFARAWRAGYQPAIQRVREGDLPWTRLDDLHRMILDQILGDFGLDAIDESIRQELTLLHYKPDPETYLGVCDVFAIEPAAMMMVAAHPEDLLAARSCRCKTAFVARPLEFGGEQTSATTLDPSFDLGTGSHVDLVHKLEDGPVPG